MASLDTYQWQEAFSEAEVTFGPPPPGGLAIDGAAALAATVREFRLDQAMRIVATRTLAVSFTAPFLPLPGGPPAEHPAWVTLVLGEVLMPSPVPPAHNPLRGLEGGVMIHAVISGVDASLLLASVLPVELHRPA